ncbi:MAG: NAD-dependent epimerase/dehydratase family protein [Bacteroidota bacterium]
MMITLVTGGTGLVGSNIIKQLLLEGRKVRAMVRSIEKGQKLLPEECELVQGDVTDIDSIRMAMDGCEVVYHAAGFPEQWMRDNSIFQKINVEGTRNMAQVALEKSVTRFVYTSTIDVLEGKAYEKYDESKLDPQKKHTHYERSKQEADKIVVEYLSKGLPAIFIHPSAVYGPGPSSSDGVNEFIRKTLNGELPALPPGGMPFVYSEDVGKGHVLAEKHAKVGERFILSESYQSLQNFVKIVLAADGKPIKLPISLPYPLARTVSIVGEVIAKLINKPPLIQNGQLTFLQWKAIPDSTKAQKELNWKPTPIEDGVKKTIEYLKRL